MRRNPYDVTGWAHTVLTCRLTVTYVHSAATLSVGCFIVNSIRYSTTSFMM